MYLKAQISSFLHKGSIQEKHRDRAGGGGTPYTSIKYVRYYHDHASYQKPLLMSGLVGMGIAYLFPLGLYLDVQLFEGMEDLIAKSHHDPTFH